MKGPASCTGPLTSDGDGLADAVGEVTSAARPMVVLFSVKAQTHRRIPVETEMDNRWRYFIVLGARSITANTALRLARFFGTSERFWLNLQAIYDLEVERDRLQDRLVREVEVLKSA